MAWLMDNLGTIIVSVILLIAAAASLRHIYRTKKNGGCVGCPNSGSCCSHCGSHSEK